MGYIKARPSKGPLRWCIFYTFPQFEETYARTHFPQHIFDEKTPFSMRRDIRGV